MTQNNISHRITTLLPLVLLSLALLFPPCISQPGVGQEFLSNHYSAHPEQQNSSNNLAVNETNPDIEEKLAQSLDFFGVFTKLGTSWHTILQMFRTILNLAGGTQSKDDIYGEGMEEALTTLKTLVPSDWNLNDIGVPFEEFDKNLDDLYRTFLNWAAADGASDNVERCVLEGGVNGRQEPINVSKAYRRLERYATWMKELRKDIVEPPLTASSLQTTWKSFSMKITYDDCQRLVWWLDLGIVDLERIRNQMRPKEITRIFVWLSHFMMFNENAQENGMVFCNSLANIGFWPFMTMLPLELGMQLDEFVISVIPLKTKFVLLMQRPPWAKFAFQMLKPFMKRTMRRRVVVIEDGLYPSSFVYEVLGNGTQCIPTGLDAYVGSPDADIVGTHFNSCTASSWKDRIQNLHKKH
jgi:hypothetical protein